MALINRSQFLQTVPYSARRGSLATLDIKTPSKLKIQMLFLSIVMVEKAIHAKDLKCSCSYSIETPLRYTVRKNSKAWTALAAVASLTLAAELVPPYILFGLEKTIACTEQAGPENCTS